MWKHSFEPIIPDNPQILILGSLPGDLSLAQQQYYAHPQNRFWKLLFHIYQEEYPVSYAQKIDFLHRQHIALWDVCATAQRQGSMDTDITAVIPNAIPQLRRAKSTLNTFYFNGQKAQKLYDHHFEREPSCNYLSLPSTSPANAGFSFDRLVEKWKVIRK